MALPIAVQVYSVRDDAKADLRGTLTKIKAMGYDGVEFAGLYGYEPADIRDMCAELGLTPISAHVPLADLKKDPKGTIAQYVTIGCPYIAVPYLPENLRPGTDGWAPTVEDIKAIAEEAKAQGIQLLYHNHDFEFVRLDGEYALDLLYKEIPALQTELDTCWVNVGGENPADYVRKYTGRAPVVHLKDFFGEKSDDMYELIGIETKAPQRPSGFEFRPLGCGLQDFPSILAAAKDAGAKWVVVEQDKATMGKTPLESIEISINYLRGLDW